MMIKPRLAIFIALAGLALGFTGIGVWWLEKTYFSPSATEQLLIQSVRGDVMPGSKGKDATLEESRELAVLFQNFRKLDRKVKNLPNGVVTLTTARNEALKDVLISHVVGMINRVEEGRDPQVRIQSPTLDHFFMDNHLIETEIEIKDNGILVRQTSDDPYMVEIMQEHAAEVTEMVERGMLAVQHMMAERLNTSSNSPKN